ncbi:hypothetical protein MKQ70_06410 [Chitinophaga sedimenti]|uniref:alpha-glucuronidase family glycosyl hydrolase n=1 Tax=Chitinophaga sedimenti TaxID=2033606 RepID=UPI0020030A29|nr:alpha-glucuronidase family glycosyl hydrolase [Chitinophaga sedimenti]MCK7554655.1 hypothetical protein [Chitinophaga sedimenti]
MQKLLQAFLMMLAILTGPGCHIKAGDITLVQNGSAKHVIVLPDEPSRAETRAAEVLQQYLKRMSGAGVSILKESAYNKDRAAIFIGKTNRNAALNKDKIKGEGFLIASDASNIFILGGTGKGVLYGVYTILENYLDVKNMALARRQYLRAKPLPFLNSSTIAEPGIRLPRNLLPCLCRCRIPGMA